ncbi:PREDICTED: mitochondrial ubiquitin ligase activator of NFKB 1 [Ceratosolen solmsi marchali]|uniref:RING-type E3 ubiquitin transferase n=1 Tax=Ceratosolen solmsi marchali TaxID=326594 RepID=A0AAJ7DXY0_9HYME|nr:PREDICTED: mitochondrial ubiquitin ligase activator of NFKB 1 [Ceratosolen solmsi marchali]
MEYLSEFIALGIDSIIFGICLKQHFYCNRSINAVKGAEFYEVNNNLINIVEQNKDNKIKYVAIRGAVQSIDTPIYGIHNKVITGVIHKLTLKEHLVVRTSSGYWSDQEHTMQEVYNCVPFVIKRGKHEIEVTNSLAAEVLDLETISDIFEASAPSFVDYVWGFFTGHRQRGLQTTEEMLKEGSIITVIGELTKSSSNHNSLVLQPPGDGTSYYLTTMSISSLLRKLDDQRKVYKWLCLIFGTIGLFIAGILVRRYLKDKEKQKLANELRKSLEQSRKERRQRIRETNLSRDQLCVICMTNPQEIILLPCGHVCLCIDCSMNYTSTCPICRETVTQTNPVFFP